MLNNVYPLGPPLSTSLRVCFGSISISIIHLRILLNPTNKTWVWSGTCTKHSFHFNNCYLSWWRLKICRVLYTKKMKSKMHWLCNDANGLTKQISVLLTTWGLCIKSSFQSQSSRLSMFKRTLEPLRDLLLPHLAEVPCVQSCLAVRLSTYWLWHSGCRHQDSTVTLLSLRNILASAWTTLTLVFTNLRVCFGSISISIIHLRIFLNPTK